MQFLESFLALEAGEVLAMAKDRCGSHVVEAYLDGDVPVKHKVKIVSKLVDFLQIASKKNPV